MPPLTLHIDIAKGAAERLPNSLLDDERGNLYLGSTAPDIRVITRWERERTHFFDLANFEEQSGVCGFFETHPALSSCGSVSKPTAAFIAGYLSHLVTDELWINAVYRPHFGSGSSLGGGLKANVMDRALQFSLDRDRRSDRVLIAHIVDAVARCDLGLELGFIDSDTLRQWHGVVLEMMEQVPEWERFRHGAKRHLGLAEAGADEFDELVASLPDLVGDTVRYLTPELIDSFMSGAIDRSIESLREYLECA